ncbi:DegQ family serine endoprotease [uncultured Parasutterella sp.]|uniref:DegQ family serine endoprotease n=1 Tax=uncultured Parasutterella sp. TaxID=1263098 RepID=UPI002596CCD4|nr:DegQ family serine endoprotease [uncultured Parasutterella sp.]
MIRLSLKKTAAAAAVTLAFTAGALLQNDSALSPVAPAAAQQIQSQLPDFTKLVEENGKTVVSIEVSKKPKSMPSRGGSDHFRGIPKDQLDLLRRFGFPFGPDFEFRGPNGSMPEMPARKGQGSGFIISPDGIILTNHHVIDGADEITVHLTDNREFKGKVLGSDEKTDIAVVKIDAKDLPAAKLGNSEKVKVGEWVAAIGAPFGLENTVTSGIVSAKSRNLPSDQFVPFIQTDAAVNPGNSGGPLFNMKGEVIGINSQIFSTSGGFMGLSFAIPIDLALQIKDDLIKDGKVHRGKLGVVIQTLTPELAKSFGLEKAKGALVAEVTKDSAANKAKIEEGDIILFFDDKEIEKASDLSRSVASAKPSTEHTVKVLRDGKEVTLKVKLDSASDSDVPTEAQQAKSKGRLGVSVRPLSDEEKKKFGDGLFVVSSEGAAAKAGIKEGDVLLSVGGKKIRSFDQFKKAVENAKDTLALQVAREGSRIYVAVKLDDKEKKEEKK